MSQFDEDLRACIADGQWRDAADIATAMEKYRRSLGPRTWFQRFLFRVFSQQSAEIMVYSPAIVTIFSRLRRWKDFGYVEQRRIPNDPKTQWRLVSP